MVTRQRLDDTALLELVGDVMACLDADELGRALLEGLLRVVPSKWASLNEVGPERVQAVVTPHLDERWFGRFAELAHENPIYQHWVRTQDGRAYRFRDVCERRDLESTRLYRDVYVPLGIRYQMAFALPNEPDHMLAIVLHREDRDFSDAERDFVNRARPFLIQAYRNAVAHTALRSPAAEAVEAALDGSDLTAREAEVLRLVVLGGSNRAVGERLGVSERTVQKHLERAYRKLGVASRSEAAARVWSLASGR